MIRIGIDTGGTFTDFVFFDGENVRSFKLPSTPQNPENAIVEGLQQVMGESFELVHGTTVSTNAFLQGSLPKTAFICTKGFEHILAIGRQNRTELFSLRVRKPSPIIPLELCFGVQERTLKDGSVTTELDREELVKLAEVLKAQEVLSVAILFLHSYKNPRNEQIAAEIFRGHGFFVTASHEIMPEYREYERGVVTSLNASMQPVIADYVNNLRSALNNKKFYILQSNGGIFSPERIIKEPIHTIVSGPAGGVIAAKKISKLTGEVNLVTFDMGGTSTDVSVIKNSHIILQRNGELNHLPIGLPMIDIATVGAGGGSIARVDRGGGLIVGPESAGAVPGPACYGVSELATVTDAFAVIGAIIPEMFLGGKMKIFPKRGVKAIKEIGQCIGKGLFETAEGIIRVAVSSMERAIRSVTVEKGEDPRCYTLLPFGGAGGLVATQLAERMGMSRILIPPNPGVFSAMGMLLADFKKEFSRAFMRCYHPGIEDELNEAFSAMKTEAIQILESEGFNDESKIFKFLDIRYKGQSYELTVPYTDDFLSVFHQLHERHYSYIFNDSCCEIVNLRILAAGKTQKLKFEKKQTPKAPAKVSFLKEIFFNGEFRQFNVYHRSELTPGQYLTNPSLIVSNDATVIVPEGYEASIDAFSNIFLKALNIGDR